MKTTLQEPVNRRQKVVDSMAKKFADHGNVEQIIIKHRKKSLGSGKTISVIVIVTVITMIISGLFTAGIVEPHLPISGSKGPSIEVKNPLELLIADLDATTISPDQFVLYCKDYLIRYDSLPQRYQTPFSTTSSSEVYRKIVDVWPTVHLRTRQKMLNELPRIETEQQQRNREPVPTGSR